MHNHRYCPAPLRLLRIRVPSGGTASQLLALGLGAAILLFAPSANALTYVPMQSTR
jgi:hypothetical protein